MPLRALYDMYSEILFLAAVKHSLPSKYHIVIVFLFWSIKESASALIVNFNFIVSVETLAPPAIPPDTEIADTHLQKRIEQLEELLKIPFFHLFVAAGIT